MGKLTVIPPMLTKLLTAMLPATFPAAAKVSPHCLLDEEPTLYVVFKSGMISELISAPMVSESVLSSPITMLPSATMLPVALMLPYTSKLLGMST